MALSKHVFIGILCLLGLLACSSENDPAVPEVVAEEEQALAPLLEGIGDVNFPISSENPRTQQFFNQGLTFAYAFNHTEAERAFREALRLDPQCAICYWGIALVLGPNYNQPMPEENIKPAWEATANAINIGHFANEKEQRVMNTLASRYVPNADQDRAALDIAYMEEMAKLAEIYPEDAHILTLYAESLMNLAPWNLYDVNGEPTEYTNRIISTLDRALELEPSHPGALHYFIHAIEPSSNPELALAAADKLGPLVPVSGHLVHMPSHIYLRVGDYQKAIDANQLAIQADALYVNQCSVQGFSADPYYPHNLHFLWYAAMAIGQDQLALDAAQQMFASSEMDIYSTIPMLTEIRFGLWQQALDTAAKLIADEPGRISDSAAIPFYFTTAIANAKLGNGELASAELEKLASALTEEQEDTPLNRLYGLVANAVVDGENGDVAAKIQRLEEAVAIQAQLPYYEPPTFYIPIKQILGTAYIAAERYDEAIAVFQEDLAENPKNPWSFTGISDANLAMGRTVDSLFADPRRGVLGNGPINTITTASHL